MSFKDYYDQPYIRCPSCNENIADRFDDYRQLLKNGTSVEEALNKLGIFAICSRIAMMNPHVVYHNMQNDSVVRGYIDPSENIEKAHIQNREIFSKLSNVTTERSFAPCAPSINEKLLNTRFIEKISIERGEVFQPNEAHFLESQEELIFPTEVGKPIHNPGRYSQVFQKVGDIYSECLTGVTFIAR